VILAGAGGTGVNGLAGLATLVFGGGVHVEAGATFNPGAHNRDHSQHARYLN